VCRPRRDRAGVLLLLAAAEPRSVSLARNALMQYAARAGASEILRDALGLAVTKACVNLVVHGERLEVRASRVNGPLVVEIRDPGRPEATVRMSYAVLN
jgi:anti-sigma regulatory factor (Ser/Thr protein kinase)